MTHTQQPVQPKEKPLLAEYLTSLLLISLALFFTALVGTTTILQGKIRLIYSYWQCFPCLLILTSACFIPNGTLFRNAKQKVILAAVAMLTLSPFPTWAVRSHGNIYFEFCSIAWLATAFWLQLEACQLLRHLAENGKNPLLAVSARKNQFLLLCFGIVPVCSVYGSGLLGMFTGTSRSLLKHCTSGIMDTSAWFCEFACMCLWQFSSLRQCNWLAIRQQKKLLADIHSEQLCRRQGILQVSTMQEIRVFSIFSL